jgi:hypothetical protein
MNDMLHPRDQVLVARVRARMALVDRSQMLLLEDEVDDPREDDDRPRVEPPARGAISGG